MLSKTLIFAVMVLPFAALLPAQPPPITCSSDDGKLHYCKAETRAGVRMVKQRSGSPCQQGYSWGFDERGIWVDHGCRADFSIETRPVYPNGLNPGNSYGRTVTCSSDDGGRHHCDTDVRAGVQMAFQRSGSPCRQGYSWGLDDRGIWVDHGCRADFAVGTAADPNASNSDQYGNYAGSSTVSCASDDGHRHHCDIDTRRGIQLVKQRSGSPCQQGVSWDYDAKGVWVDRGCRADFRSY